MKKIVSFIYYWIAFVLSVIGLVKNGGLLLAMLGIVFLPVIILHFINGIRFLMKAELLSLRNFSATIFLILSLLWVDGVHTFAGDSIQIGVSIFLLVLQILLEINIVMPPKKTK